MTIRCRVCGDGPLGPLLRVEHHPFTNRFTADPALASGSVALEMVQCRICGVIQQREPPSAEDLEPPVDWLQYNEPEGHLDEVAAAIVGLPGVTEQSRIAGVTSKDDTLLERLRRRGIAHTWRLDPVAELGGSVRSGLETIQAKLTRERAQQIASVRDAADVLIARHVLEHAHETQAFVAAIRALVKPGGYLLLEVPDCTRALDTCDYTTLWEEHVLYLTPATFDNVLAACGLDVCWRRCFPYTFENALVAIARPSQSARAITMDPAALESELARGRRFSEGLERTRDAVRRWCAAARHQGRRLALFGAGHLASTYLAVMGVEEYFECVIDDNPHKQGLRLPGSRLTIVPSAELPARGIDVCLMTLSPESEASVLSRQADYQRRGGIFASIFPTSPYALQLT